jgi:hypothetical protein
MSFKKSWDASDIMSQIQSLSRECTSPHNDGYTGWYCKQDLYQIQEAVNEALRRCPTFSGEQEWLTEREQQRIIKILKQ